jgi:hypothetical protein
VILKGKVDFVLIKETLVPIFKENKLGKSNFFLKLLRINININSCSNGGR